MILDTKFGTFGNYQDIGIAFKVILQIAKGLVVFIRNGSGMNEQLLGTIRPKIEQVEYKKDEYKYLFGNIGVV